MNASPSPDMQQEGPADASAVRALLMAAFGGAAEADLVEHLRRDGDLIAGLVVKSAGVLVGYAGFVRLALDIADTTVPAVGLAPLAVAPSAQRQGIGTVLVKRGLASLQAGGERLVFVLGDPAYYRRFGFALAPRFASPYAGPHFMVLRLAADAHDAGTVSYPRAFAGLR